MNTDILTRKTPQYKGKNHESPRPMKKLHYNQIWVQESLKSDAQIVATTSQNNEATKLTNENKKDEKYSKNTTSMRDQILLARPCFEDMSGKIDIWVMNMLSKNQLDSTVNESAIVVLLTQT